MNPLNNSDLFAAVPSCTVEQLAPRLCDALAVVRDYCEALHVPFKINSAYRSQVYEKTKGRSGASSHCKGLAVDLAAVNHDHRRLLVFGLLSAGFRRIGIARTFIHADMDDAKAPSMWLYDPSNNSKTF